MASTNRCTRCTLWRACEAHIPIEHYYESVSAGEASSKFVAPLCEPKAKRHVDQMSESLIVNGVPCTTCTDVATKRGLDLTRRDVSAEQCSRCGNFGHLFTKCTRRAW